MKFLVAVLAALSVQAIAPPRVHAQGTSPCTVIVNANTPITSLSKRQLADIFLKKITQWPDGSAVTPVDQDRNAKITDAFARAVHNRSAASLATYWQTQIFAGKEVPPAVKRGDAAVASFVGATPGAIGYVTPGTPLGASVKAITVKDL